MNELIKLGVIGMSPGNGHPYSWSAIFNGYDKEKMASCPFATIPQYLGKRKPTDFGIEDVKITHIWTQDIKTSRHIAEATLIPNIVENMEDMAGQVDAVLLARDDGENHLTMARPFIEAGLPILIDKPLTDNLEDLREFIRYYEEGKLIMSCSSGRYMAHILELNKTGELGEIQTISAVTHAFWRTYGIHAIETIYAMMGKGVQTVQNLGPRAGEDIVHLSYGDGRHAVIQDIEAIKLDMFTFFGNKHSMQLEDRGAFPAFKAMLEDFVKMLKTGKHSFDWRETVEMAKVIAAGSLSQEESGKLIHIEEIV